MCTMQAWAINRVRSEAAHKFVAEEARLAACAAAEVQRLKHSAEALAGDEELAPAGGRVACALRFAKWLARDDTGV